MHMRVRQCTSEFGGKHRILLLMIVIWRRAERFSERHRDGRNGIFGQGLGGEMNVRLLGVTQYLEVYYILAGLMLRFEVKVALCDS